MDKAFNLSYIITTRNRLPYLQILLEKLIAQLLPDEEIVVVDANSSDGSKEYLQGLFDAGKIHQYLSEPDRNQAQGWNKAMLMARGMIIKKLIDDDVHSFDTIRRCKDFMLKNDAVDICISNCLTADQESPGEIYPAGRLQQFKQWQQRTTDSFTFSDVYMLVRKSALSYIGLYDTQFVMMDWEYSLRCSYLRTGIAYYTGYNSLAVGTPGNVTSSASAEVLRKEGEIGGIKYNYKGDRADISLFSEFKIAVGKAINYRGKKQQHEVSTPDKLKFDSLEETYNYFYERLDSHNQTVDFEFIFDEAAGKN